MKKILLLNFLLLSFIGFAQDCSSLRQTNETYGAGEGKDVSWCNMQNPTAYTQCMCEQEKANKVSAIEQQNLQKQALSKSTEASALYQQASNLATQVNLDKDPSKLDEAKALYQQAIALSNQAKDFIEQAYAGADPSYNRLKNLYLEQYNKQIAWATTGIEGIPNQKDRIKAETKQKQITLNPKKPSTSNNWNLSTETKAENSWASADESIKEQPKKTESNEMDSWTQEETIAWIGKFVKDYFYNSDNIQSELIFTGNYLIDKVTHFMESANKWSNNKQEVLIKNFKDLQSIELDYRSDELLILYFSNEHVNNFKHNKFDYDSEALHIHIYTSRMDKLDKIRLIDAFVHLAILNGADKSKIEK